MYPAVNLIEETNKIYDHFPVRPICVKLEPIDIQLPNNHGGHYIVDGH